MVSPRPAPPHDRVPPTSVTALLGNRLHPPRKSGRGLGSRLPSSGKWSGKQEIARRGACGSREKLFRALRGTRASRAKLFRVLRGTRVSRAKLFRALHGGREAEEKLSRASRLTWPSALGWLSPSSRSFRGPSATTVRVERRGPAMRRRPVNTGLLLAFQAGTPPVTVEAARSTSAAVFGPMRPLGCTSAARP